MYKNNATLQIPYGTKDILDASKKRALENNLAQTFTDWGYQEVITPTYEYLDTFNMGSDDANDEATFKFFDRNNRTLVLRPDMTTPIARLASTRKELGEEVDRLFYIANVFRYEQTQSGRQCEFYQAGVELLGAEGPIADAEILALAINSLKIGGLSEFTISLGHVNFIKGLLDEAGLVGQNRNRLKELVTKRDVVGAAELVNELALPAVQAELLKKILFLQGDKDFLVQLQSSVKNDLSSKAIENLLEIYAALEKYDVQKYITFDLGLIRNMNYYSGMVFEGYSKQIGYPICGGGRYDRMLGKFGEEREATGFALGIERLMLSAEKKSPLIDNSEYITVALPKGKLFDKSVELLAQVGYTADDVRETSRKLVITNEEHKIKFIITKTMDLPTYVEHGAADIGIIGKDVLLEEDKEVYELLDMQFGLCKLVLAVPEQMLQPTLASYAHMRVGTKYPKVTENFFLNKGLQMEIIKLNGSIELAPMVGLSELIVDIVETGTTMKANKLSQIQDIKVTTARLIANRISFRTKFERIYKLVNDLRGII